MIKKVNYFSKIYVADLDDTIDTIATKFNVAPEIIREFNDFETIKKGDLIFVPKQNMAIHIVKPAETLESIASKYNVTKEYILEKNKITTLFIGLKLYI